MINNKRVMLNRSLEWMIFIWIKQTNFIQSVQKSMKTNRSVGVLKKQLMIYYRMNVLKRHLIASKSSIPLLKIAFITALCIISMRTERITKHMILLQIFELSMKKICEIKVRLMSSLQALRCQLETQQESYIVSENFQIKAR